MTDEIVPNQKRNEQLKGFSNLFFNLILPTLILNKFSKHFGDQGPIIALVVALLFPLSYGIYDYFLSKKSNILAIIGIINILSTGGFALFKLSGIWFAVKEATIPLLIGLAVLISSFTKKPFIHLLIFNENLMNVNLVKSKLEELKNEGMFFKLLRSTTIYLSFSFFLSSLLNFLLAKHIFVDIATELTQHEQSIMLNEQIAQMTWKSYLVIALPSLVVTSAIIFYLVKGVRKLTGLEFSQVLKS